MSTSRNQSTSSLSLSLSLSLSRAVAKVSIVSLALFASFSSFLSIPSTHAALDDGVFGDYFSRMIRDCNFNLTPDDWTDVVTGFQRDTSSDPNTNIHGKTLCTSFAKLLGNTYKNQIGADGQFVKGIDADGKLKFDYPLWKQISSSPTKNISYMNGNVGIGTENPGAILEIAHPNGILGLNIKNITYSHTDSNLWSYISFVDKDNIPYGFFGETSFGRQLSIAGHYGYDIYLGTYSSNTSASYVGGVTLKGDTGNVGINNSFPQAKLDVSSSYGWTMRALGYGFENSTPKDQNGSISVNDIYIRSAGKWASEIVAMMQNGCPEVRNNYYGNNILVTKKGSEGELRWGVRFFWSEAINDSVAQYNSPSGSIDYYTKYYVNPYQTVSDLTTEFLYQCLNGKWYRLGSIGTIQNLVGALN